MELPPPPHEPLAIDALQSISLSGMNAAQMALQASAQNMANLSTPGHRREHAMLASALTISDPSALTGS
jgi:flagellar basal body rod protein FlgG